MTPEPTTPASREPFGHWAVILATALAITLGYVLLVPPDTFHPARRPSGFRLRLTDAGAATSPAIPEFMRQPPPLEIAVLTEIAKEEAAQ